MFILWWPLVYVQNVMLILSVFQSGLKWWNNGGLVLPSLEPWHWCGLKTQKNWFISWNWLQNNESRESVRLFRTVRQDESAGHDASFYYKPALRNSKRLWLKRLAAHLWKPMFFNETLVIKWTPWLFQHKTTREDKTMCVICGVADPSLFITIFHSLYFFLSLSVCLILPPIFFFSHFAS